MAIIRQAKKSNLPTETAGRLPAERAKSVKSDRATRANTQNAPLDTRPLALSTKGPLAMAVDERAFLEELDAALDEDTADEASTAGAARSASERSFPSAVRLASVASESPTAGPMRARGQADAAAPLRTASLDQAEFIYDCIKYRLSWLVPRADSDLTWHSEIFAKDRLAAAKLSCQPASFVLPDEAATFRVAAEASVESGQLWMIKPALACGGNGIKLLTGSDAAAQLEANSIRGGGGRAVAQQYIMRPLLFEGRKVDFRVYVVVLEGAGANFEAWLYPGGFARAALRQFTTESLDLAAHLTNVCFAKRAGAAGAVVEFEDVFRDRSVVLDSVAAQRLIRACCTECCLAAREAAHKRRKHKACSCFQCRRGCIELLGVDILIDADSRAWVLEVNTKPQLRCESRRTDLMLVTEIARLLFSKGWAEREAALGELSAVIASSEVFAEPHGFERIL